METLALHEVRGSSPNIEGVNTVVGNIVHQTVDVSVVIDGRRYLPTELETKFDRFSRSDMVTATVVPERDLPGPWTGSEHAPRNDDPIRVYINDTRVFTGYVHTVKTTKEGAFEVEAVDAVYRLKNATVDLSITEDRTLISSVVQEVCRQAGVVCTTNLTSFTRGEIEEIVRMGGERPDAVDYPVTISRTNVKAVTVLDTLRKWANADWWVNNRNVVRFGLPDSEVHHVEYVKETSAGKSTPAYRGVRVFGSPTGSEEGVTKPNFVSEARSISQYGLFHHSEADDMDGESSRATGTVKVTLSVPEFYDMVFDPSSRFKTNDGREYRPTETVTPDSETVHHEVTVEVEVEAVEPGPEYNIGPHMVNQYVGTVDEGPRFPEYIDLVTNPEPITGGYVPWSERSDTDSGSDSESESDGQETTNPYGSDGSYDAQVYADSQVYDEDGGDGGGGGSSNPSGNAGVTQQPQSSWRIFKGITNDPVYTVREKEVDTQAQLDAIGLNLIRRLREQTKGGSVTTVGNADIDTLDVIVLPETMGGERYIVSEVTHRIDSEGFTTKIGCAGLVPDYYGVDP